MAPEVSRTVPAIDCAPARAGRRQMAAKSSARTMPRGCDLVIDAPKTMSKPDSKAGHYNRHLCAPRSCSSRSPRHLPAIFGVAAQGGARPPDIAGEWRLDQGEDPGQPPLADYLGLALQRSRPSARRHDARIDLGHAGVSVPAALGAASVARRRRRAHPEGARSDLPRDPRLPRAVHALARSADLRRRPPASAGVGAAQLERLLDRRVGSATR